jgi:hypothetical protein
MKKIFQTISLFALSILMLSCNQDSLQKFYVDAHENPAFVSFDMPASLLQITGDDLTEEDKAILNSVKKVNVVAIPGEDQYQDEIKNQEARLKSIFKNKDYQELMKFQSNGISVSVYFTGNEDAIDEIILYGNMEDNGFGVARVLGDKMNIAKLMDVSKKISIDPSNLPMDKLSNFTQP